MHFLVLLTCSETHCKYKMRTNSTVQRSDLLKKEVEITVTFKILGQYNYVLWIKTKLELKQ